jgi:hypothetical protein
MWPALSERLKTPAVRHAARVAHEVSNFIVHTRRRNVIQSAADADHMAPANIILSAADERQSHRLIFNVAQT